MKTLLTKLSLLSLVLTMGLASCTEEDGTGTGDKNGVTELSANARNSTAINVRWKGGSATDTLYATSATGTTTTYIATQGTTYNTAIATGLSLGTNYTFTVHNAAGTSAGNITWSPAKRWPSESNVNEAVQLWSTADPSPNHPSGLIIDADGIEAVSVNGARKAEVDVVLGYSADLSTPVRIISPGIDSSGIITTKRTYFGAPFNVVGGLDNDYYTGPITLASGTTRYDDVLVSRRATTDPGYGASMIIPFLTDDGHYGRIELLPSSTTAGQVFTTDASLIESVMVKVSYQTQADIGYVARGTARGPVRRISTANAPLKH
jgi:hypothetical protein